MRATRHFTLKYLVALFFACLIGFLGISAGLLAYGREPIWTTDGLSQHVNSFIFIGRGIREALSSFFSGNGFAVPTYAFQVGYGTDYAKSFMQPFSILSALCPAKYSEFFFIALIFVRIFLASVAFSYYSLRKGQSQSASFVGALCYAFCGQILFWGYLRHPSFINGAIIFPLILAGADKVFERKGSGLFVVALGIQLFLSAYIAYMECVALLAYCLLKYFLGERKRSTGDFLRLVGRFAALSIVSFCIAGIALAPSIISLISLDRVSAPSTSSSTPLLYSESFYRLLPGGFFMGRTGARAAYIGSIPVISAIAFIICRKRIPKHEWIVWMVYGAMALLCLALPRLSSIFNGFNYPTDRWMFIGAFVFSYITCMSFDGIRQADHRERMLTAVTALTFLALASILYGIEKGLNARLAFMGGLFIVSILLVVWIVPSTTRRRAAAVLSICVVACSVTAGLLEVIPGIGAGKESEFLKIGSAYESIMEKSSAAAMDNVDDNSVFRYSMTVYNAMPKNSALNHSKWGIDSYTSSYNQAVNNFRDELGIATNPSINCYIGSDSRLAVDLLSGAKYFVVKDGHEEWVPYSYTKSTQADDGWDVWKTNDALPIAFTTGNVVDVNAYSELTMAQRQEALLQACVVDTSKIEGYNAIEPQFSSMARPFTIESTNDLDFTDGKIKVHKKNASITLGFEGLPHSETYLSITGIGTKSVPSNYDIEASTDLDTCKLSLRTRSNPRNSRNFNWIKNLGYSESPLSFITLSFPAKGTYTFDSLEIICQPVAPIIAEANKLSAGAAKSEEVGNGKIEAVFESSNNPQLALFTIAYSPGWHAYIDGQPANIIRADTAFMAVELPSEKGKEEHRVTLEFISPGIREGALCSILGIIAFSIIIFMEQRTRRKSPQSKP